MIKTVVQCSLCTRQEDAVTSVAVPPKAPRNWYTINRIGLNTLHLCSDRCLLEFAQKRYAEGLKR